MNQRIAILYICPDHTLGGSTQSLIDLIESVKDYVDPIILLPSEGPAYEYFQEHHIESIICPFIRLYGVANHPWSVVLKQPWKARPIKYLKVELACIYRVLKYLKGRRIDIVHTNLSGTTIGVYLAKLLKAKHVWHIRELLDLHFNYEIYLGMKRLNRMICKADARIAISSAVKNHMKLPNKDTWVVNDAIRSKKEASYTTQKDKYLLFSAYYIVVEKGVETAIRAFAKSEVFKGGYKLRIMGNCADEYMITLQNIINEYDIEKYVEFIPCQMDVKPYFIQATAYIMASKDEGLGRVTGEAMFFGCPVIAHASGGSLDMVQDGETGYLFTTEEECADKIRLVCSSNQERIILNAQKYIIENQSREVYGPKMMEVYNRVLIR